MRNLFLAVIAALFVSLASTAKADLNTYTWSGFFENSGPTNPWGLAGDGSSATVSDGSAFTINVFVSSTAPDIAVSGNNALFNVTNTTDLKIGGNSVLITNATLRFIDNLDAIIFTGSGTFNGSNQLFSTGLFVPTSTFSLLDNVAPDAPPVFLPAGAIGDTYSSNGSSIYSIVPKNNLISVSSVPEPCLAGPLLAAMVGAPVWRRFRKSQKA